MKNTNITVGNPLINSLGHFITNFSNLITGFVSERKELFNALDSLGIEMSNEAKALIQRKGKFKSEDKYVINELIMEMNRKKSKRNKEIQKESRHNVKERVKAVTNARNAAIKDSKNEKKSELFAYRRKYGFFKGSQEFKKSNEDLTLEDIKKVKDLYLKNANIPLFDRICEETALKYTIECNSYKKVCEFLLKKSEGLDEIQSVIQKFLDNLYCLV